MAEKAKSKAKKKDNKNLIICICAGVAVVIIAIVVAIIFATRGPVINDDYFVSDDTKYVLTIENSSADDEYTPIKTHYVYTYSGDKITGALIYGEFKDAEAAKAAYENAKEEEEEGIKSITLNGKYVVIESEESTYADLTTEDVKSQIEFYEMLYNLNDGTEEDEE